MPALTLLINGQEAEYFDRSDFPLVLRRQAVDYKDPSARKGETSFTVKLPNTAANKRILGPLYTLAQTGKFRTGDAPRCQVYVGDTLIINGKFVIRAITFTEIEGFIAAAVADFAADLQGRSLRDLDLGSFVFKGWSTMMDNIIAQRFNLEEEVLYGQDYTHTERVICFPLISYGNPFLPNKWTAGRDFDITDWSPLYGETFALPTPKEIFGEPTYHLDIASTSHLSYQDVPPCVYVVKVLEAIFAAVGWTLRGAWLNSQQARRLVMPYVGDRPYIYNWEYLAHGVYLNNPLNGVEAALEIRASQAGGDPDLGSARTTLSNFSRVRTYVFGGHNWQGAYSYAQSYYRTSVPLGGTVNLPAVGGGQILDNWRTYIRVLSFPTSNWDYAFAKHTRRFATWESDNPNQSLIIDEDGIITQGPFRSDLFIAPVDGIYSVTLYVTINTINAGELVDRDDNPVTITGWNTDINGLRFAFGISKIPGGGDVPAALDGEFTVRQNLTGIGADKVVNAAPITAPGLYNVTGQVRLERGDALAFWVAMTSPYAPDKAEILHTDYGALGQLWVGPYSPFQFDTGHVYNHPFSFRANLTYSSTGVEITCANLPETPARDRFGLQLNPGQNLPDISQIDFLKSLINLFNLWLNVNAEARTVTIQTADDFFLPATSAHDLTDKAGPKTFEIRPPDLPGSIQFIWSKDGDDFLTAERGASYDVTFITNLNGAQDTATIDSGVFASTEFDTFRTVRAAFQMPEITVVDHDASPLVIADTVGYYRVNVDVTAGVVTVKLPANPDDGQRISIKDYYGFALTNNITVDGNGHTIDGSGVYMIDDNFAVAQFEYDGSGWVVDFGDSLNDAWASPSFVPVSTLRLPVLADKDALFRLQNESAAANYAYQPRLLIVKDAPSVIISDNNDGIFVRAFDDGVPQPDHLVRLETYIQLNFVTPTDSLTGSPYPTLAWNGADGLYARFYRDLYAALARGYEAEAAFRLTAADWLRMTVNRPIVYDGVLYYLKEIKAYNPLGDRLTTVTLVK